MAKLDYVAHDDEGRAQQFIVFRDNIDQFVVPLGIQPADPDIAQQALVDFQATMQQAAQGWTAEKNFERDGTGTAPAGQVVPVLPANFPAAQPPGIVPRFRQLVKRLRANRNFTDAMAQTLGIAGAEHTGPDLTTIQPDINVQIVGTHLEVGWDWQGYRTFLDLCEFQVDRHDGHGFVPLTHSIHPGCKDVTPFPATPAVWQYRAIFHADGKQVGIWSQLATVTVGA